MTDLEVIRLIRTIPDFPKAGIKYRDITTLIKNGDAFRWVIDRMAASFAGEEIDIVVGAESRGFLFSAPLAYLLNVGFVPMRKGGRLPAQTIDISYDLEYGQNTLEIHQDAITPGQKILIVDDLLATGGTVQAMMKLIETLGGVPVGACFLIELSALGGRGKIRTLPRIFSLVQFDD